MWSAECMTYARHPERPDPPRCLPRLRITCLTSVIGERIGTGGGQRAVPGMRTACAAEARRSPGHGVVRRQPQAPSSLRRTARVPVHVRAHKLAVDPGSHAHITSVRGLRVTPNNRPPALAVPPPAPPDPAPLASLHDATQTHQDAANQGLTACAGQCATATGGPPVRRLGSAARTAGRAGPPLAPVPGRPHHAPGEVGEVTGGVRRPQRRIPQERCPGSGSAPPSGTGQHRGSADASTKLASSCTFLSISKITARLVLES